MVKTRVAYCGFVVDSLSTRCRIFRLDAAHRCFDIDYNELPGLLKGVGAIVDLLTLNDYGSASACSLRHGVCFRILDASLFLIVQPLINIGN
jgi:hypothetical protein